MAAADGVFARWRRRLRDRQQRWFGRRQPARPCETLGLRNIYIFPTGHGFMFLLLIVVCWITGTNYENNLILAVAFMLSALWVSAMHLTYLNLAGLRLDGGGGDAVFAGEVGSRQFRLQNPRRHNAGRVRLTGELDSAVLDLGADASGTMQLSQPTAARGWLAPPRLHLVTLYPLGLFRAFSKPRLQRPILVYPAPRAAPRRPGRAADEGQRRSAATLSGGDLGGLEEWQPGQPRSRIVWKKYAAGRGLVMRTFEQPQGDARWICWDDYEGLGTEARLSAMCHEVLAHGRRLYGVRLPGAALELGCGDGHRERALRMLALHEAHP